MISLQPKTDTYCRSTKIPMYFFCDNQLSVGSAMKRTSATSFVINKLSKQFQRPRLGKNQGAPAFSLFQSLENIPRDMCQIVFALHPLSDRELGFCI
jgi:hypothetical protein